MGNTTLYLAYGSNMHLKQFEDRVGKRNGQVVGKAMLDGYELIFRGAPDQAVATIQTREGAKTPCLLYHINEMAEALLDLYEGFPVVYQKETVEIEYCGVWVEAMAYIMVPGRPLNKPSSEYLSIILEAYLTQNMPIKLLEEAVKRSCE